MASDDLAEFIADDREEVSVGVPDGSVEVELDHSLRAINSRQHALQLYKLAVVLRLTENAHLFGFHIDF